MKKVAVMQPYFFPYLGYFQLIGAVDLFIVHDRVKYVKKGWINRNRILQEGGDATISLPIQAGADALAIRDRQVAADFNRAKLLNRITAAYRNAPGFASTMPLVERVVTNPERNLFLYLFASLRAVCDHLGIGTPLLPASTFEIDSSLKGQDMVIALCRAADASHYVNPVGGIELYSAGAFRAAGIDLRFHRMLPWDYAQFGAAFVPSLSIIDVLMFNPIDVVRDRIDCNYDLFLPGDPSQAHASAPA